MRRVIIILSLISSAIYADIQDDYRIDFYIEKLKKSWKLDSVSRFEYLRYHKVPYPYPNIYLDNFTPEEALDNFDLFLKNQYDEYFSFEYNWNRSVAIFNRKFHSSPIPIFK